MICFIFTESEHGFKIPLRKTFSQLFAPLSCCNYGQPFPLFSNGQEIQETPSVCLMKRWSCIWDIIHATLSENKKLNINGFFLSLNFYSSSYKGWKFEPKMILLHEQISIICITNPEKVMVNLALWIY